MTDDPILILSILIITIFILPIFFTAFQTLISIFLTCIGYVSSMNWLMRDTFNFSFDTDATLNLLDFEKNLKEYFLKEKYRKDIMNKNLKNLFENYYLTPDNYSIDELYSSSKLKYSIFYDLVMFEIGNTDDTDMLNDPVECSSIKHNFYKDYFKNDIDLCIDYFTKFYVNTPEKDIEHLMDLFYDILLLLQRKNFIDSPGNTSILLTKIDNLKMYLIEHKGDNDLFKEDLDFKLIELYKAYLNTPCKKSKKYCQTIVDLYNNINSTLDVFPESFLDTVDLVIKKINRLELDERSEHIDNLITLNSELDSLIDLDLEIDSLLKE